MRIPLVEYDNASDEVKKLWDDHEKDHIITNMKRTLLNEPDCFKVLMEWYPLRDKVAEFAGEFGVNIFAHAISTENDCLICSTFFRKILKDCGKNPDDLELKGRDALLAEYGRACVKQPIKVSDELYARMKEEFTDEQIIILTTFAGMMIATNLINHALEVDLDDYLTLYTKK